MTLFCIELSHHTAPVALREMVTFSADQAESALELFRQMPAQCGKGMQELALLSTCNRTELYGYVEDDLAQLPPERYQMLLRRFLAMVSGVDDALLASVVRGYVDEAAVLHLCRVSAGLESQVVGEPQILGQVTQAYETATAQGTSGAVLTRLFRAAIRVGKRARTETAISRNAASISTVAIQLARRELGDLADKHVIVVGAGRMGELTLQALQQQGIGRITIVNRTLAHAHALAERFGATAHAIDELVALLPHGDLLLTSTGAPHIILTADAARAAVDHRPHPLIIIDIAVPRDVEPAVGRLANVRLYDMDMLSSQLDQALALREQEIPRVERIIDAEMSELLRQLRELDARPTIAELHLHAEQIRRRELDRALRNLPEADSAVQAQLEHLSRALVRKLLHQPTQRLRREAGNGNSAEYAAAVRDLFGL